MDLLIKQATHKYVNTAEVLARKWLHRSLEKSVLLWLSRLKID